MYWKYSEWPNCQFNISRKTYVIKNVSPLLLLAANRAAVTLTRCVKSLSSTVWDCRTNSSSSGGGSGGGGSGEVADADRPLAILITIAGSSLVRVHLQRAVERCCCGSRRCSRIMRRRRRLTDRPFVRRRLPSGPKTYDRLLLDALRPVISHGPGTAEEDSRRIWMLPPPPGWR